MSEAERAMAEGELTPARLALLREIVHAFVREESDGAITGCRQPAGERGDSE